MQGCGSDLPGNIFVAVFCIISHAALTCTAQVVAWSSGDAFDSINESTLHRAGLAL